MLTSSSPADKCPLCTAPCPQTNAIFKYLLRKLRKLLDLQELPGIAKTEGAGGFLHLVGRLGLGGRGECGHARWAVSLRKSLKCSPEQLDYLCDLIACKVSERYYQLWLLQAQVKNVAKSHHLLPERALAPPDCSLEVPMEAAGRKGLGRESEVKLESGMGVVYYPTTQTSLGEFGMELGAYAVNSYSLIYPVNCFFNPQG